jgi:hypothetical protein
MKTIARLMVGAGMLLLAGTAATQTTSKSVVVGEPRYAAGQMTGTVVAVDGSSLLARMEPSGTYRWFTIAPDRQFIIDGQPKTLAQLTPGTALTATVITKTLPVDVRTTTITNCTILDVNGLHVAVRLENGERRSYTVPESFKFNVDGKSLSVYQLQKGMRATATKIVSDPEAEISALTVVTGKAPK